MSRRLLDAVLVVDVEATCWKGATPPGEASEIIEIGVCLVDVATGERRERESILVKPVRSTVSAFCTELTTITPEMVEAGIPFAEACALLRARYRSGERVWASYGDYDRSMFERQCRDFDAPYPFSTRHINMKTLAALLLGLESEIGMAGALRLLDLPLEGTHHRGGDDAANIAGIFSRLLLERRAAITEGCRPEGSGS